MKFPTVGEVEKALQPYAAQARASRYTLDNVRALAAYVGNPQDDLRVVHIAGTSGKTTTSYYVANLLAAAEQKVGLTVSPHIVNIAERAQILGDDFNEQKFCAQFSEYFSLVQMSDITPSYFELMMVFAFWLFAREKVDYAVIETGLGGLLDASNICRRSDKLCVITDIGYDHMNILGGTLTEIAAQKAGIIAPGNAVLMYRQSGEVMTSVQHTVASNEAQLQIIDNGVDETFLERNFRLAREAYQLIAMRDDFDDLSDIAAMQAMRATHVPGRIERLQVGDTFFVLDGAHNPQKLNTLFLTLDKVYGKRKWPMIVALKADKDVAKVTDIIAQHVSEIVTTEFFSSKDQLVKSYTANELGAYFDEAKAMDFRIAAEYFVAKSEKTVLVTGSFYLVSEIRAWLIAEKHAIIEQ